jgi:hypothetical protein
MNACALCGAQDHTSPHCPWQKGRFMKRSLLITLALALAGCNATMLTNRVSCTVAKDKALYTSMYGVVGVSSEVDDRDAKEICK